MPAERILIVGLSGRALAASARAGDFEPIVIDAFADADTASLAAAERVAVDADWRFDEAALLAAAARVAPREVPLVYGSGFDRHPDLLARLAEGRELLGSAPGAVARAKDPVTFAALLAELGIPHPAIRHDLPPDPAGWLVKRAGGAGGAHVRPLTHATPIGPGRYLQQEAAGRPVSVLVAGDGCGAMALALSEQWSDPAPERPFRFGGVAAPAVLPAALTARLHAMAEQVAARCGLKGLGSLDVLVDGEAVTVLEINLRPGASVDAYERASGRSLVALHAAAARGQLQSLPAPWPRAGASLLVWAPEPLVIDPRFRWPVWTADRPTAGSTIGAGSPVCTVLGEGLEAGEARQVAETRRLALLSRLRQPWRRTG